MAGFLSRLRRRAKSPLSQEATGLQRLVSDSGKSSGRREPPAQLDWSRAEYVPLPPSPPTWEVDGRDEFHREYSDPAMGPVFQAGFKKQHTKVVKLASTLSAEERQGNVGDVIAKAYRKLIMQRMKAGQLASAARHGAEMLEMVPGQTTDTDRRRFNRILQQMDKEGKKHDYVPVEVASPSSEPLFTVSGSGWAVACEKRLAGDERPDPAFAVTSVDDLGTWLLDRSGSSSGEPNVRSVLRRLDRLGRVAGDRPLLHDAYRTGAGWAGSSIAILDSGGTLHVYDAALDLVTENHLRDDPRVVDHFRTIDTNYWGDFKSQVRAVDVAPGGDRYIFTLADEAWCCSMSGRAIWGVSMPLNEGWERVVGRTGLGGVEREVGEALRLLGLTLPVSPADIKRRYRTLAMERHPDRNPGDPRADDEMKRLNRAFQVLTGIDPETLGFEESDVTYFARSAPDHVVEFEGGRLEFTVTGGIPQDWVYAASFAAGGEAYVATYSGKVILLSQEGQPLVVYDIGTCPTEIVDVGRYAYFLTPTRLYVIEDRTKLAAFLDVFQQGRLLVSESGFGLLTSKKLQWFTASGTRVGEVLARDPIRRVHKIDGGAVVQTRQHQTEVSGPGL